MAIPLPGRELSSYALIPSPIRGLRPMSDTGPKRKMWMPMFHVHASTENRPRVRATARVHAANASPLFGRILTGLPTGLLLLVGVGVACLVSAALMVLALFTGYAIVADLLRKIAVGSWLADLIVAAAALTLAWIVWHFAARIVRDELNDRRTLP